MDSFSSSVVTEGSSDLELAFSATRQDAAASKFQNGAKRTMDVVGALAFLIVFSPLLLGVAALVLLAQGRPLLFGHSRVGKGGRTFKCYKFRTMVTDGDSVLSAHLAKDAGARREWEATRKLKDDPRVTRFGRIMRKLSIDELPQFLNVLSGEMSLVGPRPIVESETQYYGSHVDAYFSVRPGLTGMWQVSGRSNTSYERRVRMDVDYVSSWTLRKDLMILAKTVPAVLSSDGSF